PVPVQFPALLLSGGRQGHRHDRLRGAAGARGRVVLHAAGGGQADRAGDIHRHRQLPARRGVGARAPVPDAAGAGARSSDQPGRAHASAAAAPRRRRRGQDSRVQRAARGVAGNPRGARPTWPADQRDLAASQGRHERAWPSAPPMHACVCVGFCPDQHGAAPVRGRPPRVALQGVDACEPRPHDLVPRAVPCRRVAALRDGESAGREWPWAGRRPDLQPRWRAGCVDRAGGRGARHRRGPRPPDSRVPQLGCLCRPIRGQAL
ncbi:hypothetical protein LPJ70_006158, partial [Coemansia sp. RSA 2708]